MGESVTAPRAGERSWLRRRDGTRRVVITGMGAVTPIGVGVDALWQGILEGRSGEALVPPLDQFNLNSNIFGAVQDFDARERIADEGLVERNDRYALFAIAAAHEAVNQAGLISDRLNRERVGVNVGTAVGGCGSMEQGFLQLTEGGREEIAYGRRPDRVYAYACPATATLELAGRWGFQGPTATTSTGCTSGIDSVGYAWNAIRSGEADAFVAGASDAPVVPIAAAAFDSIKALTRKPREWVGRASSPFSAERDGFILAEAAGVVVLESLEHAAARGAEVLAEVDAYATTSNAFHMTGMPAEGVDLSRAIDLALEQAGLRPREIDYLNAHGSSTPQNDRGETAAYYRSFGRHARGIPVSSLKSQTGHPLGAASAVEIISSVLAIRNDFLPPTINYRQPDELCDLFDYVPNKGRSFPVDTVLTDASGFCGLHSAMIIRGYHW